MNSTKYTLIAVDVGKYKLDVCSEHKSFVVSNNERGFRSLLERYQSQKNLLIVCESTAGYERKMIEYLQAHDIAVARINPAQLRAFAKSKGVKVKSDKIDRQMILQFAQQQELRILKKPDCVQVELMDLMDRRTQLSEYLARDKNRLDKASDLSLTLIKHTIEMFESELEQVEQKIRDRVQKHTTYKAVFELLVQVQGVGEVTAWSILAYLGELGQIKRNQIAALAGLAPYNNESATIQKIRRIEGGRAKVRKALYMAAHNASIFNPVIREYTQRLKQRGKPHKWVMVAAMRKLLLHLHFLTKNYYQSLA